VGRSDGQFFQYDARGYLTGITGSQNVTPGYDAFGRLATFSAAHATAHTYDSTGLRVVRTVDGTDRRFVYDLAGARPRVAMEAAGDNTPVAWYVYGPGLAWKVTADGTAYFYHFDGDGNVVALSNAAQGIVNSYRYDPTGTLAETNEGIENGFRARGAAGWVDDGNGLVYTGTQYQYAAGLTLPALANPEPPTVGIAPSFGGGGACLVQGVTACGAASARRDR
jgi:YD repeat-containing protein